LRGVGNPNIQNNLLRTSTTNGAGNRTALLGIDDDDVSALVSPLAVPTNAFDPAAARSNDFSMTFRSTILGAVPREVINPNAGSGGADPAFVGEFLSAVPDGLGAGGFGNDLSHARDWRLLHASPLAGLGTPPAGGVLAAANGTTHTVPSRIPEMSYDFDGEGYGNLRVQGGLDVGFDQTDVLIVCGGYANDTRDLNGSPFGGAPTGPGAGYRLYILPGAGTLWSVETRTQANPITGYTGPFVSGPSGFFWAYSTPFGVAVPPRFIPGLVGGGGQQSPAILWLDSAPVGPVAFSTPLINFAVPAPYPYSPRAGAGAPLPGGVTWTGTSQGPGATQNNGEYLNEQVAFNPDGTADLLLSNVQCSRD
jgi:hypothetical protein